MIGMFKNVVVQFIGLSPFVIARNEATKQSRWGGNEIATHLSGARNDKKRKALNDRMCLINQATTKMPKIEQEIKIR